MIFVDHTRLFDVRGAVPDEGEVIPFGVVEVKRVSTLDVPIPLSRTLEHFVEPTVEKVVAAARELVR